MAALVALGLLAGAALAVKAGDTITVRVMSAKVMTNPKFIGPVAANVSRGDFLTVEEVKGDWFRVKTSAGATGWINRAHVTDKKVTLSSKPGGSGSGGASQDEVELAGRGFTPEVEGEYKNRHPEHDFSHVDAIEKTSVDPAELAKFVAGGGL
jgi:hypothetical protein